MLLKNIVKLTKQQFVKKKKRRHRNKRDRLELETTVLMGKKAVDHFFQQPQFHGFTLAIIWGNRWHECVVFFREGSGQLEQIYFNPNFSKNIQAAECNNVALSLMTAWGKKPNVRAYYASNGNVTGECVGYVWQEIFIMLCAGLSPFHNNEINAEDCSTIYQQKKENDAVGPKAGI